MRLRFVLFCFFVSILFYIKSSVTVTNVIYVQVRVRGQYYSGTVLEKLSRVLKVSITFIAKYPSTDDVSTNMSQVGGSLTRMKMSFC